MLDFPLSIFQYLNGLVLCISTCSFQKSQWKNFLDPCHVIKLDFHEIFLQFKKKVNSGKFRNKSYEHFTIYLPVRIFVNHEKNYHFVIVSLSNHESTLVSIKWTFWAYLEFTSFTYMVIITIFLFHGLNTIIEHLRYTK